MKLMPCPLNGLRDISEFAYGGELREMPDPDACGSRQWADYLFLRENRAGVVREWWCHLPSSYWFIAERDTVTDEILRTWPASEQFRARVDSGAGEPD